MKHHALSLEVRLSKGDLESIPEGVLAMFGCHPDQIKMFIDQYIIDEILRQSTE